MQYPPTLHEEQLAGHTIFSHVVPLAVYPLLHETAVHVPADEHAVQVPFSTVMVEHNLQVIPDL